MQHILPSQASTERSSAENHVLPCISEQNVLRVVEGRNEFCKGKLRMMMPKNRQEIESKDTGTDNTL